MSADKILTVNIETLSLSDHLAREPVNQDRLTDLAASIKRHGILHPLVVRTQPNGYEVISGSRRLAAARLAGITEIPVVIQDAAQPQPRILPAETRPEPEPARRPAPRQIVPRQMSRRPARPQSASGREPSGQPVKRVRHRRPQTLQFGRGQLLVDYEAGTVDLRRARFEDLKALIQGVGEVHSLDELIHWLERLSPHL